MKNKKSFLQGVLCGTLAMLLVAGLISCGRNYKESEKSIVTLKTEKKLNTLNQLIDMKYLGEVDEDQLAEGVYAGFIKGLGDEYSEYYDAEKTKTFKEITGGTFEGIGAVMTQEKDTGIIRITHVYEHSPAQKAGIREEDLLYKVNGQEVTGIDLSDVVAKVRGEKGTTVKLSMLRGKKNKVIEVEAVRDVIETETVDAKMLENGIGYLRVSEFAAVTYEQYKTALEDLENQGIKALIVDLRGNPGGSVSVVSSMLDLMLPEGLTVYTQDKSGKKDELTSDEEHKFTKPMMVLVNGNSASASEIYAGAIQDYGIGKIVGTQTYGKGVVQQVFDLKDGTCVKLTIAEYFTPKGRNINKKGITPDIKVDYEYNKKKPEADNQLNTAIKEIKKGM